jgi:hypothetical protein
MSANEPNAASPAPDANQTPVAAAAASAGRNAAPPAPDANQTPAATAAASAGRNTPNYTDVQDLLISKAFIHASQDAAVGVGQKGAVFKNKFLVAYNEMRAEQLRLDSQRYATAARIERGVIYEMGLVNEAGASAGAGESVSVPNPYPDRTADALYRRFKDYICPAVAKFLGLETQNPGRSGGDKEIQYTRIAFMFKKRFGTDFVYRRSLEYLRDKPKFMGFMETVTKTKRPAGKKQAMVAQKDAAVMQSIAAKSAKDVVSAVAVSDKENIEAKNVFYRGISSLAELGSNYMMMQVADEDTKKRMAKVAGETALMKMELELLEMKKKKQKLLSDDPTGSIDLSGDDVDSELSAE